MAIVSLASSWVRTKIEDDVTSALWFGVRRAFKHRDVTLPNGEDLEEFLGQIVDQCEREVTSALYEVFEIGREGEREA